MPLDQLPRPQWLTFDCYGTLIQWDEGLQAAVARILAANQGAQRAPTPTRFLRIYDEHEHRLERTPPHRRFADITREALRLTMHDLGLEYRPQDAALLTDSISAMPPFPEVVDTLALLKRAGFRLCIISNTDDAIIAGNVAQLGGHVDRVVTAEQAGAYKPSRRIFAHAHDSLGVTPDEVVHICASPHLDHAAARDIGFRCVWIDRGTGRQPLPDYRPDATVSTLDQVPGVLRQAGWM
ncbi:haloacid dehalogenase type II [Achromobacter xylosoxidans]|uniref:haloacid dehalogenase type II n=1 Tax=Alcaligenes xylosoxydans xylosoxydans TaxID=85698 RepID=UPI001EEA9F9E|nr:haloacid dehalogenase type II [Achromobacter xylosoxidans]MDZ5618675.1 haloacid dehalogenase type II [Achromobacter xylosoxidans]MDZ5629869.1 haloacid dehalogenase type II [Achromobacter xylosoxidans]MDZ5686486.1 haloacid dehalogenase type II [Achromobacter xylosoxidans]